MKSINPYNQEVIKEFTEHSESEIQSAINQADETYQQWKQTSFSERKSLMLKAAEILRDNKSHYATIMTQEMGKHIRESTAEVEKCALVCEYYAEKAEYFLQNKPLDPPDGEAYIHYNSLGIVLAVMPWNFPFWQVFRFAAPNLMAGNVGILKHASNVPQSALAIEEVFEKAGFPTGCFTTLLIDSKKVNLILENDSVKAATLTGSEFAGSKVAEKAGSLLKKTVLELGGSDPFIVLKDADVDKAVETAVTARMINTGQSCIAAKRFIVEKSISEKFIEAFKKRLASLKLGDPMDESVDYGPMAREDLAEELEEQLRKSINKGAKLIIGGKRYQKTFFEPTLITDVKPGMPAYDEELFGPVAVVLTAENEDHAVELANDSNYGLGGSLWSKDIEKARKLASRVESGAVYINKMMASHPTVPFGGIKLSGYGRELSELGIKEFVNQKTVWIAE